MYRKISSFALSAILLLQGEVVLADEVPQAESFSDAVIDGKPLLQLRLRYEYVDQANKAENANAWTLRSLVGWQTKPYHDVSVTAQLINLTKLSHEFYDNARGRNQASPYPTVQDPDITDVNQLFVEYSGLPQTKVRLGRQIVQLDNVRFIGDVGFRQDSQVFDGVSLINTSLSNVELFAAHFEKVRQTTTKLRDTNLEILHAAWKFSPTESVAGYGYFQDQPVTGQNTGFSDNSNQILGLRLDGNRKLDDAWKLLYTAEYAKQDDYDQGDDRIKAHYLRLGGGAGWNGWYVRLDQEILSSNHGLYGFQTPLATLHPFQGWADQFTTTPKDGMRDTYLSFGGKVLDVQLMGEWHRFIADHDFAKVGGGKANHYGDELNLGAAYAFTSKLTGKAEYAKFNEGDVYSRARKFDTEKIWLTLVYSY